MQINCVQLIVLVLKKLGANYLFNPFQRKVTPDTHSSLGYKYPCFLSFLSSIQCTQHLKKIRQSARPNWLGTGALQRGDKRESTREMGSLGQIRFLLRFQCRPLQSCQTCGVFYAGGGAQISSSIFPPNLAKDSNSERLNSIFLDVKSSGEHIFFSFLIKPQKIGRVLTHTHKKRTLSWFFIFL